MGALIQALRDLANACYLAAPEGSDLEVKWKAVVDAIDDLLAETPAQEEG